MGRGIVESGLFRSERYGLELRTADPPSHSEGEAWIRTDIAPDTNQLATLRFNTGGGTIWDIPVYDSAASVTNVTKAWRVPIGGTVGFIPITTSSPAFPAVKYQHAGSAYGAHDALTASAIPDSEDLQARYDATKLSLNDGDAVTTWADETGNGFDLTAGTAPTYKTSIINGNSVVRCNGVDEFLDVAWTALSQPNTVFVVFKYNTLDTDANETIVDGAASRQTWGHSNSNEWIMYAGSPLSATITADTNPHIGTGLFNTTSSDLRLDGTQIASGGVGSDNLDGFRVGSDSTGAGWANVDVGEILVYPQNKSGIYSDVESYLSSKWGITI